MADLHVFFYQSGKIEILRVELKSFCTINRNQRENVDGCIGVERKYAEKEHRQQQWCQSTHKRVNRAVAC